MQPVVPRSLKLMFPFPSSENSEEGYPKYNEFFVLNGLWDGGLIADCAGSGTLKKHLGLYESKLRLWPGWLRDYPRLQVLHCQSLHTDVHHKTSTQQLAV